MSETLALSNTYHPETALVGEVVPAYAAAEARVTEQSSRLDAVSQEYEQIMAGYDPSLIATIDEIDEAYYRQHGHVAENSMNSTSFSQHLRASGVVPEPIVDVYAKAEAVEADIRQAEADLELHTPEKATAVLERVSALEAAINYDNVAREMRDRTESRCQENDVSHIIIARTLLAAGHPFSYAELQRIDSAAAEFEEHWRGNGFLAQPSPTGSEHYAVAAEQVVSGIVRKLPENAQEITDLKRDFDTAREINSTYRQPNFDFARQPYDILNNLDSVGRAVEVPSVDNLNSLNALYLNDTFQEAIMRPIADRLAALPAQDFELDTESDAYKALIETARTIDVAEALAELDIVGDLAALPFEISELELKQYLEMHIPGIALQHIKRVEFRALTEVENPNGTVLGSQRRIPDTDNGMIVMNTQPMEESYKRYQDMIAEDPSIASFVDSAAVTKKAMLETLVHEYGHGLHTVLPAAALKRWNDAVGADDTHITAYVKQVHDSGKRYSSFTEDFSDTMAFFVKDPAVLKVISDTRFQAMREIYNDFMANGKQLKRRQAISIATMETCFRNGTTTPEAVRNMYLEHEHSH